MRYNELMHFSLSTEPEPLIAAVTTAIFDHLRAGRRVLWLLAGGSAIPVEVAIAKRLRTSGTSLESLTVTLTDERYGPVGHADSNWQQLETAGFVLPGARLQPVLSEGASLEQTAQTFAAFLGDALSTHDYRLGLFGIGADGHTAGVLPHSPAVAATALAASYDAAPYQRVTMTFPAIKQLDEAMVYAIGKDKWPVLDQLQTDISLDDQPAQMLKQVPRFTIFNDHIGESV